MENRYTPEIRFIGFTEDWDPRKLDSIVDRVKSYSLSRDVETSEYTGYKYIHYGDIHTKVADVIDESSNLPNIKAGNYELLEKGDLVVADASEDYQGIATPAVITIDIPYKLVSGLHTIALRPKQVDPLFLYYLINSPTFRKYGYKTGTGMKVFGISVTNLLKFEGMFPLLEEQTKIGIFLKQLDDTIALHLQELTTLKRTKQGFLQKMFPKEGESVPEVRFPGFTGEWEQVKLGDIYDVVSGFAFKMSDYVKVGVPIINGESIQHGSISNKNLNFLPEEFLNKYQNFILETGDIVLGLNRPITNGNLKIAQVPEDLHGALLYQRAGKIIVLNNSDINFSYQLLGNEVLKFVLKEAVGSDQPFISTTKLKKWLIRVPVLEEEQIKIGLFFKILDDTIDLYQRELVALKETKKAFLQRMFV